jgi:hypothetical protein
LENKSAYRIIFISMILLALIASVAGAQGTQGCGTISSAISSQITQNEPWYCAINQQIYSQWQGYLPIAVVVIFLSFGIAAVIFMIGVALNSNRIRNFGIGEFYEAIATAIIIVAFLYLCSVMFGVFPGIAVGNLNPFAVAFHYISTTINTAETMYSALFSTNLVLSYAVSSTVKLAFGGSLGKSSVLNFISFLPQLFVNVLTIPVTIYFIDPTIAIAGFLTDGIAALYAEYYILVFFATAAIPVFLIPGIFFRAIIPTRSLGGIMIAMAFGFFLVMPSLFAVAYYFTTPTVQRDMSSATLQVVSMNPDPQLAISSTSPLAVQLQSVKTSLNGFWLMIFFYPALIIAITYAAIREIASFIGRAQSMGGRIRGFI